MYVISSLIPRQHANGKDTTLALSRLVLSQVDPVTALASRKTILHDEKVFNLNFKGLGPTGEYPGPRVNQYSSGRCWLFATSMSSTEVLDRADNSQRSAIQCYREAEPRRLSAFSELPILLRQAREGKLLPRVRHSCRTS